MMLGRMRWPLRGAIWRVWGREGMQLTTTYDYLQRTRQRELSARLVGGQYEGLSLACCTIQLVPEAEVASHSFGCRMCWNN